MTYNIDRMFITVEEVVKSSKLQRSCTAQDMEVLGDTVHDGLETWCNETPTGMWLCRQRIVIPTKNHQTKRFEQAFPKTHDVCPHNGTELSTHPPRSRGQPVHLSPLPSTGLKRSTRRQNPKVHGFFSFLKCPTFLKDTRFLMTLGWICSGRGKLETRRGMVTR